MMYSTIILLFLVATDSFVRATNERDLKGKAAVVTGGANGIGYAIVENYLKAGASNVIIVDKDQLRGLLAERTLNRIYGPRVLFIHGDVTTDLDRVWNVIFRTFGCVDILVNNAGILEEYDPGKTILTNLLAPMLWSERFFNCIRKDRGGKGGTIMNVASTASVSKDPVAWNYKASKFGVLGFTYALGHEYNYLTSGVRVFAICPDYTLTDMVRKRRIMFEQVEIYTKFIALSPRQEPEAVGQAAAALFKTAATGMAYIVQGGEISVAPDVINYTAKFLLSL